MSHLVFLSMVSFPEIFKVRPDPRWVSFWTTDAFSQAWCLTWYSNNNVKEMTETHSTKSNWGKSATPLVLLYSTTDSRGNGRLHSLCWLSNCMTEMRHEYQKSVMENDHVVSTCLRCSTCTAHSCQSPCDILACSILLRMCAAPTDNVRLYTMCALNTVGSASA